MVKFITTFVANLELFDIGFSDNATLFEVGFSDNTANFNSTLGDIYRVVDGVIEDFLSDESPHPVQNKVITKALNDKVDKIDGKTLSTNDFTDEYKSKIDNMKSFYKVGHGLLFDESTNTLSVDVVNDAEEDNTKPITSAAVYTEIGNINSLLHTI